MITLEQARAICQRDLDRTDDGYEKVEWLVTECTELSDAWVVYYQSRAFLESENFSDCLVGNGPYVICKKTGGFTTLRTTRPLDAQIEEALRWLRQQEPRI